MSDDPLASLALNRSHRKALIELGSRGAGGQFDQQSLGELFCMGLVEVRNEDRRLTLTDRGRAVYVRLLARESARP